MLGVSLTPKIKCSICKKTFKNARAIYNHHQLCKALRRIQELEKEIEFLKQKQYTLRNEYIQHLQSGFIKQCIRRRDKGLIELITSIYHHPKNKHLIALMTQSQDTKVFKDIVAHYAAFMSQEFYKYEDEFKETMSESLYEAVEEFIAIECDKIHESNVFIDRLSRALETPMWLMSEEPRI